MGQFVIKFIDDLLNLYAIISLVGVSCVFKYQAIKHEFGSDNHLTKAWSNIHPRDYWLP